MRLTIKPLFILVLAGLLALSTPAAAVETGIYSPPDGTGHGVFIACNEQSNCVVYWFNHLSPDEQVWLMGVPLCPEGAAETCDTELTKPSAPAWNGRAGALDIGPSVGSIEITPMDDEGRQIAISWDVRQLRPDSCTGVSIGGLLLRGCVGSMVLTRLAR